MGLGFRVRVGVGGRVKAEGLLDALGGEALDLRVVLRREERLIRARVRVRVRVRVGVEVRSRLSRRGARLRAVLEELLDLGRLELGALLGLGLGGGAPPGLVVAALADDRALEAQLEVGALVHLLLVRARVRVRGMVRVRVRGMVRVWVRVKIKGWGLVRARVRVRARVWRVAPRRCRA